MSGMSGHYYEDDPDSPGECKFCALPSRNRRHLPSGMTARQARSVLDSRRARDGVIARMNRLANESDANYIDRAIRTAAESGRSFSANDIRPHIGNVPTMLVGARFLAASKSGLIRHTGARVMSTDPHVRHPVNVWVGRGHADAEQTEIAS